MRRYARMIGNRILSFIPDQRGNVIVMTSLSLVILLGMTGLVIDGGLLMATRAQMQKAANAAALSAAQELTNSESSVTSVATNILFRHAEHENMDLLDIRMNDRVTVGLTKEMPLGFARLFGFDKTKVSVDATAELGTMGAAIGAAPLGIDKSIELVYNTEYRLKVDQTEVEAGYFGVLALGGPGAATYEDNLRYGYQGTIAIDDVLETQTGNIAGKTRTSIAERVNNCPYTDDIKSISRDCSRVILVPVYEPVDYLSNQLKKIRVVGFAYFYITEPMSASDTYITGKFIERAGTGFVKEAAVHKGAYAIRLTE